MSNTVATATETRGRRLLIGLLFVAITLNYVDRQVLALLKPTLMARFGWNDSQYADLGQAFQYAAAASFIFAGWIVDRLGVRRALGAGVIVWSLAGMAHALAGTVRQFILARVVLASAETIGTPATVKASAVYLPLEQRAFSLALGNAAPNVGQILTPLLIPPFALMFGWRAAFLATGALGFAWILAWLWGTRGLQPILREGAARARDAGRVPIGEMLADRRTWAIAGAKPLSDAAWFFLLFWIPDFFNRVFHMSQARLGLPVAIIYSFAALGSLSSGVIFPRLVRRGWSLNRARKSTLLFYACLVLPLPLALLAPNPWLASLVIGIALFAHQGFSTSIFGLTADMTPSNRVATVIAVGAVAGNIAGAWMIQFAGWSLTHGHGYWPMFGVCAAGYLLAVLWIHLMQPVIRAAE